MKKPIIILVAMLIAAAAAVGSFLAVKSKKDKEDKKQAEITADNQLFSFDQDSINRIDISFDGQSYTALYDGSEWSLESGEFPLDQDYFINVCTYVSTLTAETSYPQENDIAKYGLDTPGRLVLSDGTNSYALNVGDQSPTGEYFYITVDGKDKIYAIDFMYGSVLKTQRAMMKSKALIPYEDREIAEIIVKRNGKTAYDLKYDPDSDVWSLPEAYSMLTFDQTAVSSLTASLTRLDMSVSDMLEEDLRDLSKYGFDKPVAEAVFKGIDGSEVKLLFNDTIDPDGVYTHVLMPDGQAAKFYTYDVAFIKKSPIDFILKSLTLSDINSATGLDYICGDADESYKIDLSGGKLERSGAAIELSDSDKTIAFRNFFNSISNVTVTDVNIDVTPKLTDPLLTAVFYDADGKPKKYQLTSAGNGQCYIFIDDEYTGMLMDEKKLSGKNSVAYFRETFLKSVGISE